MLKPKATLKSRHRGNTTTEYALIGSMICLVSLTGLLSLSGAFSAKVSDLKISMKANTSAASAEAMQIAAMNSIQNPNSFSRDSLASDAFDAGNSVGHTVTTGANGSSILGSTNNTGGNLESTLPGLSKKDQNLVQNMANTAHEIAKLQQVLEQFSMYSNGNINKFRTSSVVVDGTKMTARELALALGDEGLAAQLAELVEEVQLSGMKKDLKKEVNELSKQVEEEAKDLSEATQKALSERSDPTTIGAGSSSEETDLIASEICEKVGKKDKGKKCE